ncbi:MAG: DUF839 domain-containing protein [Planctomycetota bacterium]
MRSLALVCAVVAANSVFAQTFPLPATTTDRTAVEGTAPFLAPTRMVQRRITDRNTLSLIGLPATFGNWDMVTFDATSRYVFVPAEVGAGAGIFRYDTQTGVFTTLFVGNNTGIRESNPANFNSAATDYARIDPCTLTPWNTIVTGEETTGGRFFEVTNPLAASGPYTTVWRSKIPAVAHEGIRFDSHGTLYFIDEDNSGSIYKFVPATPGDLSVGQTFVLSADAFAANPSAVASQTWNSTTNRPFDLQRFGPATWVPMTDAQGNALTTADPFAYVTTTGGRTAADELKGTPYGRPEDLDINVLANGHECVYVSVTSENRVLSIELLGDTTAMVRQFVNFDTINLFTGTDVNPLQNDPYTSPGSGTVFQNPDNICVDHFGSIYIIEDNEPGDIWKAIDADKDGVAEAMGLFLSEGVGGAEPTGLYADPNDPYRFICCVQHPNSGNDALWSFDTRPYAGTGADLELRTGVNHPTSTGPGEFVKTARAFDALSFTLVSPNSGLDLAPFAILAQVFPTSAPPQPFLPPLWINPFVPFFSLAGGFSGGFQFLLPPGGSTTTLRVPFGLNTFSVSAQGLAISPQATLVATDAHEIIFN